MSLCYAKSEKLKIIPTSLSRDNLGYRNVIGDQFSLDQTDTCDIAIHGYNGRALTEANLTQLLHSVVDKENFIARFDYDTLNGGGYISIDFVLNGYYFKLEDPELLGKENLKVRLNYASTDGAYSYLIGDDTKLSDTLDENQRWLTVHIVGKGTVKLTATSATSGTKQEQEAIASKSFIVNTDTNEYNYTVEATAASDAHNVYYVYDNSDTPLTSAPTLDCTRHSTLTVFFVTNESEVVVPTQTGSAPMFNGLLFATSTSDVLESDASWLTLLSSSEIPIKSQFKLEGKSIEYINGGTI